jgi:amino-acid N-acetyltransferase
MLPRALSEIYENVRDFFVIREDNRIIGCVALHICWSDLGEVRSLAVDNSKHKHGLGRTLVRACVDEARDIGMGRLFCLTYQPDFFQKCGFKVVDKSELPRKIWSDCFRCPKFPDCDEVSLVYDHPGQDATPVKP